MADLYSFDDIFVEGAFALLVSLGVAIQLQAANRTPAAWRLLWGAGVTAVASALADSGELAAI